MRKNVMKKYAGLRLAAMAFIFGLFLWGGTKAVPVQAAGEVAINAENFPDENFRS